MATNKKADVYIQFRIDSKIKEDFKKAIKKTEPYLINSKSDGVSAVLLKYIHQYIKESNDK